jgi:hypothetical protein
MKNFKKLLIVAIVFMIGTNHLKAQITIGPQIGYSYSLPGIQNLNLGLRGDKQIEDNTGIMVSLAYHLPYNYTSEIYLNASSSSVTQARINTNERITGIKLLGNLKRYIASTEYGDDFGLYGILGLGVSLFTQTSTLDGEFDRDVYFQPRGYEDDKLKESYLGFSMNGGIGAEFLIGDNPMFLELKLLIPASSVGNQEIDVQVPGFVHLTAGYRF